MTCPVCGNKLSSDVTYTYPPVPIKICWDCGWCCEEKENENEKN